MRAFLLILVLVAGALAAFLWLNTEDASDAGVEHGSVPAAATAAADGDVSRLPVEQEAAREVAATDTDTEGDTHVAFQPSKSAVVRGFALASRKGGVEGARVYVQYRGPDGTVELGEVRTGFKGEYSLEVSGLGTRLDVERQAGVWVRVDAPGFRVQEQQAFENPRDRGIFEAHVRLDPGFTLQGRVVDASHSGVSAAAVELVLSSHVQGKQTPHRSHYGATTDSLGRYWIGFSIRPESEVSLRMLEISAHAAGVGWSIVPLGERLLSGNREVADLVLVNTGEAAGTVLYPDGEPASGLELTAVRSDAENPGAAGPLDRDRSWSSMTTLGEDGRFRFVDLCPGKYTFEVLASGMHRNFVDVQGAVALSIGDDAPGTAYAPSGRLELILDLRRIVVRVLGADGRKAEQFGASCFPDLFLGRAISSPGFFGPGYAEPGEPVVYRAKPGTALAVIAWDRERHADRSVPSESFAVQKLTVPDFPLTTELVLTLPAE